MADFIEKAFDLPNLNMKEIIYLLETLTIQKETI